MSSILIVESKNDQAFIELVVQQLIQNLQSQQDIKCRPLKGDGNLTVVSKTVVAETEAGEIDKIGIILDLDEAGLSAKLKQINDCLQTIFVDDFEPLTSVNEFASVKNKVGMDLQIACYFMGVDGVGELETVLKTIKNQNSAYADCLEAWKKCLLEKHKINIKDKEFNKTWINNYIRLDTCIGREKNQRDKNCNPAKLDEMISKKPDIWDLEHECLTGLKNFLSLFLEN